MRSGVFVTGTDTGIGKTVVAACLVHRWQAAYWKPVQTGLAEDAGDSAAVAGLSGAESGRIHPPRHAFQAPLSPEAASRAAGCRIALEDFRLPAGQGPIVVEGAGGVLVPLGEVAMMTDLMARLGLPVLLVARSALGTINHTLLSLEALRARGLPVWGVMMVGTPNPDNEAAIIRLGRVPVLARLDHLASVTQAVIAAAAATFPDPPDAGTQAA